MKGHFLSSKSIFFSISHFMKISNKTLRHKKSFLHALKYKKELRVQFKSTRRHHNKCMKMLFCFNSSWEHENKRREENIDKIIIFFILVPFDAFFHFLLFFHPTHASSLPKFPLQLHYIICLYKE